MPYTPSYTVDKDRQAYTIMAGPVGCLMLHGFLGSPISSRPLAEYLAARGVTMHCPLLPGHGELPNKCYGATKEGWMAEAEEGLHFLQRQCDEIVLMGHSMGTILGAKLATQNNDIRGQIMLAPAYTVPKKIIHTLRVVRHVMPWFYPMSMKRLHGVVEERLLDLDPSFDFEDPDIQDKLPELTRVPTGAIDEMRQVLDMGKTLWPQLDIPVIIFQGKEDIAVEVKNTQKLFEQIPNQDKELILFDHAGHELMRPFEPAHKEVWRKAYEFILSHTTLEEVSDKKN